MRLLPLGLLVLVVVFALTACGGKAARRHAVDDYIRQVNKVVRHYKGAVTAANDAYKNFGTGATKKQLKRLHAAEASVLSIRTEIRSLDPPKDARRLHAKVLRLVDLELQVATSATEFAEFVPAARTALARVAAANMTFRHGFDAARSASEQENVFGRYHDDLSRAAKRFAALAPPPALQQWQDAEVRRLRRTAASAGALQHALASHDRAEIDRAVQQFTVSTSVTNAELRAQRQAIIRYDQQVRQVALAAAKVEEERNRVQTKLG